MNYIVKFLIISCLSLVYMGFVLNYMIELSTTESASAKGWTGLVLSLLTPSIIVAYITSRKERKRNETE